jgi:hypothetical protein
VFKEVLLIVNVNRSLDIRSFGTMKMELVYFVQDKIARDYDRLLSINIRSPHGIHDDERGVNEILPNRPLFWYYEV